MSKTGTYFRWIFVALVFGSSLLWLPKLKFDYRFENFYPEGKHLLDEYEEFTRNFEVENDFILIGIEKKSNVFDAGFLEKTDSLTRAIKKLKFVREVLCPTMLKKWSVGGLVPYQQKLIRWKTTEELKESEENWFKKYSMFSGFISPDKNSLLILVKTEENLSKAKSDVLSEEIKNISGKIMKGFVLHYTGRAVIQKAYLDELHREFLFFIAVSAALVFAGIWLLYKNIRIAFLLLLHLFFIMLTLFLVFFLTGKKIDIMSVMYPPLAFILGCSHAIHYLNAYRRNFRQDDSFSSVFQKVHDDIGYASRMAAFTTCIGFGSFLLTPIGPLREFGLYASLLSAIAFAFTFHFFPLFIPAFRINSTNIRSISLFDLHPTFFNKLLKNKKMIYVFSFLALLFSLSSALRLKQSHVLLEDLSDKLQVKKDLIYFEKHFSGIRPLEILVKPKANQAFEWNGKNLNHILLLHLMAEKTYLPGMLLSPVSVLEELNERKLTAANIPEFLQHDENELQYFRQALNSKQGKLLFHPEKKIIRISGKMRDLGSDAIKTKNQCFMEMVEKTGLNKIYDIRITGSAELIDRNHELLVKSSLESFILSLGVILLISLILFRKWKMFVIFIIPNLIPLLIILGIIPVIGQSMKGSTAMLFAVAIGIVVDDTFHFVGKYFKLRQSGTGRDDALKASLASVGSSMIFTSLVLVMGFCALVLSSFTSLMIFGCLMSMVVILALLCDIVLLPLLIHEFDEP